MPPAKNAACSRHCFRRSCNANKYIRLQALLRVLEEVGWRGLFWSKTRHVRVSTQHEVRPQTANYRFQCELQGFDGVRGSLRGISQSLLTVVGAQRATIRKS